MFFPLFCTACQCWRQGRECIGDCSKKKKSEVQLQTALQEYRRSCWALEGLPWPRGSLCYFGSSVGLEWPTWANLPQTHTISPRTRSLYREPMSNSSCIPCRLMENPVWSEMSSWCLKCLENGCMLYSHNHSAGNPGYICPQFFKGGSLHGTYSLKSFSLKDTHILLIISWVCFSSQAPWWFGKNWYWDISDCWNLKKEQLKQTSLSVLSRPSELLMKCEMDLVLCGWLNSILAYQSHLKAMSHFLLVFIERGLLISHNSIYSR